MKPDYPYALPYDRYRELMAEDFARLLQLTQTADPSTRVPACAEWDIAQLARHTALVYLQKAETIRTGVKPQGHWIPEDVQQLGPAQMLETCYRRLTSEFDSHQPSDPAESWVAEDQTVGFWIRRLTHESAIHRYDIEAALENPQSIDPELAVDGIDEILTVMLERGRAARGTDAAPEGITGDLVLESGGHVWLVRLLPTDVEVSRESSGGARSVASTIITGEPHDLLLWLWGRGPLPAPNDGGGAAAELRRRLAAST